MKKAYLFTLLFVLMVNFIQAQMDKTTKEDTVNITFEIVRTGEPITLKVGQKITISMSIHESTGITAIVSAFPNDKVVKLVESITKYEESQNGTIGGKATETYIFEVIGAGKTSIFAEKIYGGDSESGYNKSIDQIIIVVEE